MKKNFLSPHFLIGFIICNVLACNNAEFKGGEIRKESLPQDGDARNAEKTPQDEVVIEADGDALPITKPQQDTSTVEHIMTPYSIYQESLDAYLVANNNEQIKFESEIESKIPGLTFDTVKHELRFQADLQDIGKEFSSQIFALSDFEEQTLSVKIKVLPPEVNIQECFRQPAPVIGDLAPIEKWHWSGWEDPATKIVYRLTYSSPVAADLDGDGKIEIIVVASSADYTTQLNSDVSPIFVLSGESGELLWNSFSLNEKEGRKIGALSSTTPALADLDKDGYAEIIAVSNDGVSASKLVVNILSYKSKKLSASYASADNSFTCLGQCQTTLGDIDQDGEFEIVAGNIVLDHKGKLKFTLPSNERNKIIIDIIPQSPGAEIISGNSIYSSTGALLWHIDEFQNGFMAVADLDHDKKLELVLVGSAKSTPTSLIDGSVAVYGLNDDMSFGKLYWKKSLPRVNEIVSSCDRKERNCAQHGGAPNIGNFDTDEDFEIGIAGGDYYVVYEKDGTEKWKSLTTDWSSHQTGSSLFDLNGDGAVEVLYNDEQLLRIYNGATGEVLWKTENKSGTLYEYPLTLNIDADPSVEIVLSSPTSGGVRAFEDPNNKWVSSRKLWTQYAYYPEFINDKLQAIAVPEIPRLGFRVNTQGTLTQPNKILLPDLAILNPLYFDDKKDTSEDGLKSLSFLITNQGQADFNDERGVLLQLFDKEGLNLIAFKEAKVSIKAGESVTLVLENLDISASSETQFQAKLNLSSERGFAEECHTENNISSLKLLSFSLRNE